MLKTIKLYDYQTEAVAATETVNKGIVCLPTGLGKTVIQTAILANAIKANPGFNVYVVNAPRIALLSQLFTEISTELTASGIDVRYMNLHSGGSEETNIAEQRAAAGIEHSEIISTTSVVALNDEMRKAEICNQPVLVFACYKSAPRLINLNYPIAIMLNDEGHFLVQENFHELMDVNANKMYSFTATMRFTASADGFGMNNVDKYGEVIYTKTPRWAIDNGYIVRPRLHIVKSGAEGDVYSDTDVENQIGRLISDCFYQHQYQLKSQNPKMLVAAEGTEGIYRFTESTEYSELVDAGVKIYCIASDPRIGNTINNQQVSRSEFLKSLKVDGKNPAVRMVVVHYDILSEGIDVPGLTGVVVLRNMSKAKFIQTLGRVLRLSMGDRTKLTAGEMLPSELKKFSKPYGWVILPMLTNSDRDDIASVRDMIAELRDYGFNPYEDVTISPTGGAIPTQDGPEALNEVLNMSNSIQQALENLQAEIEREEIAKLSLTALRAFAS